MKYNIDHLPLEILQIIFENLNLHSQIQFRKVCKKFNVHEITNFYDFESTKIKSHDITMDVLINFPKIKKLNLRDNRNIRDLNNFYHLSQLNISGSTIITSSGIRKLINLSHLNLRDNRTICDLNKFYHLSYLNIGGTSIVDDDGIQKLVNLTCVIVDNNFRITDLSNSKKLIYVDMRGKNCNIDVDKIVNKNIMILRNNKNLHRE